jgi:hypothetical protein
MKILDRTCRIAVYVLRGMLNYRPKRIDVTLKKMRIDKLSTPRSATAEITLTIE